MLYVELLGGLLPVYLTFVQLPVAPCLFYDYKPLQYPLEDGVHGYGWQVVHIRDPVRFGG